MALCCFLHLAAIALFLSFPHAGTTVLFDDFDGGAVSLHGTVPDTTSGGAAWVATATNFLANGTIGGTAAGTATLAFTPANRRIYTLDASFIDISGDANWFPFGFVSGQGTSNKSSQSNENRFLEGQTVGIAWMFARANNTANPNVSALSNSTLAGDDPGLGAGPSGTVAPPTAATST